jgi:hypothetical protein
MIRSGVKPTWTSFSSPKHRVPFGFAVVVVEEVVLKSSTTMLMLPKSMDWVLAAVVVTIVDDEHCSCN